MSQKWIVLRVLTEAAPGCGHRQANLVAICEDEGGKRGQDIAVSFCADATYLIGPVPPNTMLPDMPVMNWPGSYYPLAKPASPDPNSL
jgi:hypothetical protein